MCLVRHMRGTASELGLIWNYANTNEREKRELKGGVVVHSGSLRSAFW